MCKCREKSLWALVFANGKNSTTKDTKVHEGICEYLFFTAGRLPRFQLLSAKPPGLADAWSPELVAARFPA
jgi:hypothetical protein